MENIDNQMRELAAFLAANPPKHHEYEEDDEEYENPNEPIWQFWRDRL